MLARRHRVETERVLLMFQVREYADRTGRSHTSIARACKLDPSLVAFATGHKGPEPTHRTLARIEETLEREPEWPGAQHPQTVEYHARDAFMVRWPMTGWRDERFAPVIAAWQADDPIAALSELDNVTLVETRDPADPCSYIVTRHAPTSVRLSGGEDRTGQALATHLPDCYREAMIDDVTRVLLRQIPYRSEILWAAKGSKAGAYFTRLILPIPGGVASATHFRRKLLSLDDVSASSSWLQSA